MTKSFSSQNLTDVMSDMELTAPDGVRLVSFTFGITLYSNATFSEVPDAILACYERFLQLCPPDKLRYYATESMRRHKPITKRALNMLPTWLKPDSPPREYVNLELKDGEQYQDAPTFKFKIYGIESVSSSYGRGFANLLSVAFPGYWGIERAGEMLELVSELCSIFPFQSGHAGFSLECSRYEMERSQTHAWEASMQHKGLDISHIPDDSFAVGQDAVKGVGWLTILSESLLEAVGGLTKIKKQLSREIEIIQLPGGVILKAGAMPAIGDVNRNDVLPLYKNVYSVVAPMIEVASKRSPSFNLATDYVEKTEAWFTRLADD